MQTRRWKEIRLSKLFYNVLFLFSVSSIFFAVASTSFFRFIRCSAPGESISLWCCCVVHVATTVLHSLVLPISPLAVAVVCCIINAWFRPFCFTLNVFIRMPMQENQDSSLCCSAQMRWVEMTEADCLAAMLF